MDKLMSCCGVICSQCEHFPLFCPGCSNIEGKVFWLTFTRQSICNIYHCCIIEKKFIHCGQCYKLPCTLYAEASDPTKTKVENEMILRKQLQELRQMK